MLFFGMGVPHGVFMPESFLHLSQGEQSQIYRALGPRLSRSPVVLEKDVWVCWVRCNRPVF
jgi:hypothetical protein